MKKNILGIIAIVISIVALVFSIVRVAPFTITEGTYIGIIAAFIGISVAILIGYQIFNVIEWKGKMQQLKKQQNELNLQSNKIKTELNDLKLDYHKKLLNILVLFYREQSYISETQKDVHNGLLYELNAIRISTKVKTEEPKYRFREFIFDEILFLSVNDFGSNDGSRGEDYKSFKKKTKQQLLIIRKQCDDYVSSRLFLEIENALNKRIEFLDKYINGTDRSNMQKEKYINDKEIGIYYLNFKIFFKSI